MARVQNPLFSTNAKGKFGGLVYSVGIGGPMVRLKGRVVRRIEGQQDIRRATFGYLARKWKLLTDGQRDSWDDYAEEHPVDDGFGGTMILSGFNMWIKLQAIVLMNGDTPVMTSPVVDPAAGMASLTVVKGALVEGDIDLTWTHNGTGGAADWNLIEISPGHISPAIAFTTDRYTRVTPVAGNLLLATIDGLVVGKWYSVRVRYCDEFGQTTAWLYGKATPYEGI